MEPFALDYFDVWVEWDFTNLKLLLIQWAWCWNCAI